MTNEKKELKCLKCKNFFLDVDKGNRWFHSCTKAVLKRYYGKKRTMQEPFLEFCTHFEEKQND